jgi:hypothetical protein
VVVSNRILSGGGTTRSTFSANSSVELWYYKEPWGQNPTVSVPNRKFRQTTHFYKNLAYRLECIHFPLLEPTLDRLVGDLLFSTDSSSSADDGGETSPWRTIAFALTSFP